MSWVKLDDQFPDHPKVIQAGPAAAWLYVSALCYANRMLTDGFIGEPVLRRLGSKPLAKRLVEAQLWEEMANGWQIHDYHDYQLPRAQVLARQAQVSEERSKAGSKGAANRWQTDDKKDGKPMAPSQSPSQLPNPDPIPIPDRPPDPVGGARSENQQRWEERIGPLGSHDSAEFVKFERVAPADWIREAMDEAEERADEPFPYFVAVLNRWPPCRRLRSHPIVWPYARSPCAGLAMSRLSAY